MKYRYQSLELELYNHERSVDIETFSVRVANSPNGSQPIHQADRVTLTREMREQFRRLEERSLEPADMIALGEQIAALMFPKGARHLLDTSIAMLGEDALRISLVLDTPLVDVPWEYVYLRTEESTDRKNAIGFLALEPRFSIVRLEQISGPADTFEPIDKLRLLAVLASPASPDYPPLDIAGEKDYIQKAVARAPRITVDFREQATRAQLRQGMIEGAHIFQFSGHGEFKVGMGEDFRSVEGAGCIVLVDEEGRPDEYSAVDLGIALADRGVRLAVLCACEGGQRDRVQRWTGVAATLAWKHIPGVVAMQYSVYDDCALVFTQTLYEVLAIGRSIDEAVTAGRQAMRDTREDARDWGVPVLYLRVVAGHDGVLFPFVNHVEWDELIEHSNRQTSTYWRALQGTPARPTAYIPEVYVERNDVSLELETFLARQEPAVVLLGESGVGKTNVLCRWVQRLQEDRHAVFFYDGGGSVDADVERMVARDLMVAPEALAAKLAAISEAAGMEGKQFVLVFDGINKFSGAGQGPADLLKSIDALAGRLPPNVRIVISCSTHIWSGIQRGGRLTLLSHIYYHPTNDGGTPGAPVKLDQFTDAELKSAYDLYQEAFFLHTPFDKLPAGLRSQLRKPLWLSLLAQTYKGREDPITYEAEALRVCRDYFKRYADKDSPERRFVMLFVAEMVKQQKTGLTASSLQANQQLAEFMGVKDDGRSTYLKLLDCWFLVEIPGANEIEGDLVSFSCNQIAGYAIALQVGQAGVSVGLITQLVSESRRFPFAWSAARTLLMLTKPPEVISALAASPDPELRELVVESLVQLYDEEPAVALQMIEQLLDVDFEQVQRTALKAALRIGSGAVDIFLSAGTRGSVSLRRAAKDTLYLAWQSDQVLIYDVLDRLVVSIGIGNMVGELFRGRSSKPQVVRDPLLKFIIELSVTCYINHCDESSITEKTDALYYELLKNKLHMGILKTPVIGGGLTRLAEAFTTAFSRPIVEAMLLSDLMPVERFFKLPPAEREVLKRLAQLLEPGSDLGGAKADLVAALSSDILLLNIVAGHLLPIHAIRDFKATEHVLRDLYDSLEPEGKLWLLLSFCVLLPKTPPDWVGFLEEFTSRLIREHRAVFYGEQRGPLEQLHLMLLPLGMAYGKCNQDGTMPLLSRMLREVISGGDSDELSYFLSALGTVGFYYPRAVLRILAEEITDFNSPGILAALERPLAVMRTVHFDDVDAFLAEKQIGEDYRHRISTLADVNLVQQYIWWLGLYNNVVHEVVFYPKMRRQLSMGMLNILASARDMYEVISKFTSVTIDMLCEADFHLIEWTRESP